MPKMCCFNGQELMQCNRVEKVQNTYNVTRKSFRSKSKKSEGKCSEIRAISFICFKFFNDFKINLK